MELISLIGPGQLWIFFILVLGIIALPGSDIAFVIGNTLAGGRSSGMAALSGIVLGGIAHSLMAYLGIGLILQAVPGAFSAMLFLGAAYLAWLGYQLLKAEPGPRSEHNATARSRIATMGQGIITCLLNPKAYFFMFAVFPQFIQPEKGSLGMQVIILGMIISFVQIAIYGGSAWAMSKLTRKLGDGRTLEVKLSRAMGVFLILIASLSIARGIWGG
ncbi:LysE family translocator [uncultured Litoreibacter sp.]|uniref:LysE family translocator n=1 Tax=uncultured Litoreibacter sp. TaxID=1392394 RepID=UPI002613571A|nr:LysE family translocator [uncultured Litoreibacter sp.]